MSDTESNDYKNITPPADHDSDRTQAAPDEGDTASGGAPEEPDGTPVENPSGG